LGFRLYWAKNPFGQSKTIPKNNSRKGMFFLNKMQRIIYVFLLLLKDKCKALFNDLIILLGLESIYMIYVI